MLNDDVYSTMDQEPPHFSSINDAIHSTTTTKGRSWPIKGSIVFSDCYMKYRNYLPFTLKGLSFMIHGGEKVIHTIFTIYIYIYNIVLLLTITSDTTYTIILIC